MVCSGQAIGPLSLVRKRHGHYFALRDLAETIKEASTRNLRIELFVDGRYSAQSTSDLRPDALKRFIGDAVASTKLLAADPYRSLPDPKYYEGRADANLDVLDAGYGKFKPEDRHAIAQSIAPVTIPPVLGDVLKILGF